MKLPTRLLIFGCIFLATAIAEPGRWQWGRQVQDALAGPEDPLAGPGSNPPASAGSGSSSSSSGSSGSTGSGSSGSSDSSSSGSSGSSSSSSSSDPLASAGSSSSGSSGSSSGSSAGSGSSASSGSSSGSSADSGSSGSSGSSSGSDASSSGSSASSGSSSGSEASSSGSSASSGSSSGSEPVTESTTTTTTAAPVGSSQTYTFGGASGLSVSMTFTQGENNELLMYCNVATDPSATETLSRFCDAPTDKKPKIYLVQGYTDCSALSGLDSVQAQVISTIEKPNEVVTDAKVLSIKYTDLSGNCIALLQESDALSSGGSSSSSSSGDANVVGSGGRSWQVGRWEWGRQVQNALAGVSDPLAGPGSAGSGSGPSGSSGSSSSGSSGSSSSGSSGSAGSGSSGSSGSSSSELSGSSGSSSASSGSSSTSSGSSSASSGSSSGSSGSSSGSSGSSSGSSGSSASSGSSGSSSASSGSSSASSGSSSASSGSSSASSGSSDSSSSSTSAVDDSGCPASSSSSSGRKRRMLMAPAPFTRTFNTISLGNFVILSTGTAYVAPTIVNSNAGPVNVVFGSFGGYTYDPWATLPYLQLPGWTVQSIYAIVGGLFVLYVFGLLGSSIPGVSNLFSGLSTLVSNSATKKLGRFGNYLVDRTYDGLTTFVYNGINRFKRRNYLINRNHHNYYPSQYNRKTDYAYDYYEDRDQETDYFRY